MEAKKLQCRRQLEHHLQTVGRGGVPDPENGPSEHVNTERHIQSDAVHASGGRT